MEAETLTANHEQVSLLLFTVMLLAAVLLGHLIHQTQ
jgi:hypothetical protein